MFEHYICNVLNLYIMSEYILILFLLAQSCFLNIKFEILIVEVFT